MYKSSYILNTKNIHRYVWIGRKDQHWYRDCQQVFIDLFGEDRLQLVCNLFAATSINTSLKSNITLFRRALYEIDFNKPVGKYLPNIIEQLKQIRAGKELTGRKINNFAKAMSGDTNAVVVDIWILRAFNQDRKYFRNGNSAHTGYERSGGATDKQYNSIESWIQYEAVKMGLQPRELCSMLWAGVRIEQSGDRETHYKNILINHLTNLFNCI